MERCGKYIWPIPVLWQNVRTLDEKAAQKELNFATTKKLLPNFYFEPADNRE